MNAARRRRQALKQRIAAQHKRKQVQDDKAWEKMRCQHKVLISRPCQKCDDIIRDIFYQHRNDPETLERNLTRSLGLDGTRRAFVFTKTKTVYGTPKLVSVMLSTHHPTQQIQDMRRNGFWAVDCGYVTYIAPDQIVEVCFDNE